MNVVKTAVAVASTSLAVTTGVAGLRFALDDNEAIVQLYASRDFSTTGGSQTFRIPADPDVCYTVVGFNDKATSISWEGFALRKSLPMVLYADYYCSGVSAAWTITEGAAAANLAIVGLDKTVSSFMIRAGGTVRHVALGVDAKTCVVSPLPGRLLETNPNATESSGATNDSA